MDMVNEDEQQDQYVETQENPNGFFANTKSAVRIKSLSFNNMNKSSSLPFCLLFKLESYQLCRLLALFEWL